MIKYQPWFYQEIRLLGPTPFIDTEGSYPLFFHDRWEDINRVRPLLDYCDYLASIEVTIPREEPDILTVHQATILHLLCAGIDAWTSGEWKDFGTWLTMGTKPKYEHLGLVQRNEMLKKTITNVRDVTKDKAIKVLFSGLREILSVYQNSFAVSRKFKDFFTKLPEAVKRILMEHYVIGKDADLSEVDTVWAEHDPADNLSMIANYLWDWRRNKFTHEAKALRSSEPVHFRLFGDISHTTRPDGSMATRADWVVSSNIPEHMLVRSALVASIRQAVFGDVARIHVRTHLHTLIRRYCGPEDRDRYIAKFGPYINE